MSLLGITNSINIIDFDFDLFLDEPIFVGVTGILGVTDILGVTGILGITGIFGILEEPVIEIKKYPNLVTYYINLDRRTDRNEHMIEELKYLDNICDYKRISSYDGKELNLDDYVKRQLLPPHPRWNGRPFKRGELACIMSHIKSWKIFMRTNKKYLLHLEDDVILNKKYFDKIFDKIMGNIDKLDFDWLYVGRQSLGETGFYNGGLINNFFYKPLRLGFGAHSYILSRQGAKNMIKYYTMKKIAGSVRYQYFSVPFDIMDTHKDYYKKMMGKRMKVYSIIPEDYNKKKGFSSNKSISSTSSDFLFYAKNWSDSDTTRIR